VIARNSNSPPPPSTMLVQTMTNGPQTNIANWEGGGGGGGGGIWEIFEKSTN
jgi:hypothetical protein